MQRNCNIRLIIFVLWKDQTWKFKSSIEFSIDPTQRRWSSWSLKIIRWRTTTAHFRRFNVRMLTLLAQRKNTLEISHLMISSYFLDSSQRTSVIFKAKLILLYEIIFHDEALDIMRSVEDEYNVKTKTIFGIISNWIVVVIFNVKLRFVTLVEEQRLKPWAWHCS